MIDKFLALEKKYQTLLIFITIITIISFGFLIGREVKKILYPNSNTQQIIIKDKEVSKDKSDEKPGVIVVNIKGAVEKPGIYEFPVNSRVNDAVLKAVPLTEANLISLNLAMFLKDEQDIYVPYLGDEVNKNDLNGIGENSDNSVSVNSGSIEDLEQVPGIGPVMAKKIIEYRENTSHFRAIEDLLNVSGIGEKTLEKLRPYIKL